MNNTDDRKLNVSVYKDYDTWAINGSCKYFKDVKVEPSESGGWVVEDRNGVVHILPGSVHLVIKAV